MAVGIGQNLHFDVAGRLHAFFNVDAVVVEGGTRLGARLRKLRAQLFLAVDFADAPSPAAGQRLEHDRIAVRLAEGHGLREARVACGKRAGSRNKGNGCLFHDVARDDLVAQIADHLGGRSDKRNSRIDAGLGQIGIFRQKTVARVNGVRAGFLRGPDDFIDIEVIPARPVSHQNGLIGKSQKIRFSVGFFIDGHRIEAHFLDRPDDAQGDFPPVGHQYFSDFFHKRPSLPSS
ncbi:MAG: hypothetical protein BWX45_00441 [Deltaproteobacteria bacterium ADurb.Bin002]|nr:MAG: hypothetical protein BWX45_00441 [Deltaproteobacteria bacterium ADurb.Bin002]